MPPGPESSDGFDAPKERPDALTSVKGEDEKRYEMIRCWFQLDVASCRGLGIASDKTGEVNVDMLVYLNQIMGLSDLETKVWFREPISQSEITA